MWDLSTHGASRCGEEDPSPGCDAGLRWARCECGSRGRDARFRRDVMHNLRTGPLSEFAVAELGAAEVKLVAAESTGQLPISCVTLTPDGGRTVVPANGIVSARLPN